MSERRSPFRFESARSRPAWTSPEIHEGIQDLLLVVHEANGDWQFLPGDAVAGGIPVVLHLGHILDRFPEVFELEDLPPGWGAERTRVGEAWTRFELEESDTSGDGE